MVTRTLSLLGVLLAVAAPCVAQSPGAFEIGGFARYTFYDNDLNLEDKVGGGGTLGIFFARNVALEAEAATTSTSDTTDIAEHRQHAHSRSALLHIPLGGCASAIRMGAGYVRDMFGKDADSSDDGITGLLGLRFGLGKKSRAPGGRDAGLRAEPEELDGGQLQELRRPGRRTAAAQQQLRQRQGRRQGQRRQVSRHARR